MTKDRLSILIPALQCPCGNELKFDESFVFCEKCGLKNPVEAEPL